MKFPLTLLVSLSLFGCANNNQFDESIRTPIIPDNWYQQEVSQAVKNNWLNEFKQEHLQQLVLEALSSNHNLKQASYQLEITKQQLLQSGSVFWPDLDLSLNSNRSKSVTTSNINTNHSLKLESSYEIDIWGKLSDNQQKFRLAYLASDAQYQHEKQSLVAQLVSNWFNLITAQQLTDLFKHRVSNAQQNLDIIESGYQTGVNNALDVYLSRNELNSEASNLEAQHSQLIASARIVEQLLGRYPSGKLVAELDQQTLPSLHAEVPVGIPSDLISRKPTLQAAWYQVLEQNAALAFSHKQRFPSLRLTASASNASDDLADLLSSSNLGWSLLAGITAPLFKAGELKANEEITRLRLKQQEQQYLNTLYQAFAQVENALTTESSLKNRYSTTLAAKDNAQAAETLAFEQYLKGLVSYTTVLDAQSRAFNAQSSLIQINNQLLNNRVNLHLALGGEFNTFKTNNKDDLIHE